MSMDPEIIERLRLAGKRDCTRGLFQQKRDGQHPLTDPSVLARFNRLNQAAVDGGRAGCGSQDSDGGGVDGSRPSESSERERVGQTIAAYNHRRHQGAFLVTQSPTEGVNFEGALRFYYEDGSKMAAKAVWLTNRTTVNDLMPSVQEKFGIYDSKRWRTAIYRVHNQDEILLAGEERPLDIAVNSKHSLRFVLRMEPCVPDTLSVPQSAPADGAAIQRKSLTHFFGVANRDLAVPYYATSAAACPGGTKAKLGSPTRAKKKQYSVDSLSLSSNSSTSSGHLSTGLGRPAPGEAGNDSTPGLVLKTQTLKFIKRFQSGEGHPKNGGKKDKGDNGTSKGLEPMKRLRAKSMSVLFDRGQALGTKEGTLGPSRELLLPEDSSPGLLKVFGDRVSPNATYKSVLASEQSSAVELIKVVLERFSLPVNAFGEYALCDVIGNYKANPEKVSRVLGFADNFEEKQEWMMECMRALADDERPLTVKSFWKPEKGFERRFEIWRRTDIATAEVDTITHGINVNAKRLQLPKALRAALASLQEDADTTEAQLSSSKKEIIKEKPQQAPEGREEREHGSLPLPAFNLLPPRDCPYLLTLRGNNPEKDRVLYLLDDAICRLGHSCGADASADIRLDSVDVERDHCRITKQRHFQSLDADGGHHERDCDPDDLFLDPVGEAKVTVNGCIVSQRVKLSPGDLVGIGDQYLFLLRNPLAWPAGESSALMRLLSSLGQADASTHPGNRCFMGASGPPPPTIITSSHLTDKAGEYATDSRRPKLWYPARREDDVLRGIASLLPASLGGADDEAGVGSALSLSHMMCMCVEHSAYHFHEEKTKRLMLKVATLLQTLVWDKMKETAGNQQEKSVSVQAALGELLPDLRVIVGLLSNSLEIFNFLQSNMGDYITSERDGGEEVGGGVCGIEEEALVELEEVVMYAFQQMVYYLTKTLYNAIPDFLDSNPFADDREEEAAGDLCAQGMDGVLSVFQMTFDLMRDLAVHPAIASQLFAYLLFFINASLFNLLMERGSTGKFYKWAKGAQIRGNLDTLEAWLQARHLQDQGAFLTRVSVAINLLATPKVQLMQADWKSLRHDFSGLSPAQLHYLLSHYQLGAGQPLPMGWTPSAEEMESATCPENILESFDNHPDVILPNQGFKLDLRTPIGDKHLAEQLQELKKRLPYISISMGLVDRPAADGEQSPSNAGILPVPPPRTKSYRYPSSSDQGADASVEVLERPLAVSQVAPVAVASTVKLQPTAPTRFLSPAGKISPRIFTGVLPPLLMSKASTAAEQESSACSDGDKSGQADASGAGDDVRSPDASLINGRSKDGSETSRPAVGREPSCGADVKDVGPADSQNGPDGQENGDQTAQNGPHTSAISSSGAGNTDEYGEPKKPCPTLTPSSVSSSSCSETAPPAIAVETISVPMDSADDVFVVDLEKGEEGVGLGLIDGMHTPLRSQGIYVRKLVPGGSAMQDGRMSIGDRILAVNGTSLVGADYNSAMQLIRTSRIKLRFLVAKSEPSVSLKITASTR